MIVNLQMKNRLAFTILEMLIAMAVTLLMMAALTRTFKVIGDNMQLSRANVELSSRLRTVSFRLGSELQRATVTFRPPRPASFGEGYFCYYDGPMTDSTTLQTAVVGVLDPVAGTGIAGISRDDTQQALDAYFPLSRFGDIDDYLAFTAAAEDGTEFKGIVPAFVIIQKERELAGLPLFTNAELATMSPMAPVIVTSKYAEIVYWLSPARDSTGTIVDVIGEADLNGDGLADGDGIPDTLFLRRRVLLIRPDLNLSDGFLASFDNGTVPAPMTISAGLRPLTGIHQICDLAVRRPEDADGIPLPRSGTSRVIANSLADLTLPQNRFAHIRIPEGTAPFTGDLNGLNGIQLTSMPVLDLLGPEGLLAIPSINTALAVTEKAAGGFLNASYELSGNRQGEDIVMSNVVGFDVRGFDNAAPVFIHVGADGVPGAVGDDDDDLDADFNDPDLSEFGFQGSDDVIITPNDPGFYQLIRQPSSGNTIRNSAGDVVAVLAGSQAFVDLDYVYKPAGNVIAPIGMEGSTSALRTNLGRFCASPLSGFADGIATGLLASDGWLVPEPRWKSGKLVLGRPGSNGRSALINQPTYDTWAFDYETDRHNQGVVGATNTIGTLWVYNHRPFDPDASASVSDANIGAISTIDPTLAQNDTRRLWPNQIDEGNNGIDEVGSGAGIDDATERETSPPIDYELPGIQIRLRIMDQDTEAIRQTVVTQHFAR